jgi:hypothetical protein
MPGEGLRHLGHFGELPLAAFAQFLVFLASPDLELVAEVLEGRREPIVACEVR